MKAKNAGQMAMQGGLAALGNAPAGPASAAAATAEEGEGAEEEPAAEAPAAEAPAQAAAETPKAARVSADAAAIALLESLRARPKSSAKPKAKATPKAKAVAKPKTTPSKAGAKPKTTPSKASGKGKRALPSEFPYRLGRGCIMDDTGGRRFKARPAPGVAEKSFSYAGPGREAAFRDAAGHVENYKPT